MSTPAERIQEAAARDEAAAEAEPETPDEQEAEQEAEEAAPAEPGEPEPEPDAEPAGPSEAELSKAFDKLDREAERHAKRVAEIMGEDFAHLEVCPRCDIQGFIWPLGTIALEPEKAAAVKLSIGEAPAPDYAEAPDAEICATCRGLGDVLTGSKKQGQLTKLCPDCSGAGWRAKGRLAAALPVNTASAGNATLEETAGTGDVGADAWNRPAGHPHWGVPPASVGV